ncbi:hypothetical protein PIB30_062386 [Stylosanthes scabra]|uniref:Uncharacterized protein n=1 Tax=Stylosanthes scabra TaxID=79078 RepID=A0ABU6XK33_9FABA|nr:hypothetical protein [Stylosanthes scabra]
MGGVFFETLNACAFILVSVRHGVFFFTSTSCTILFPERGYVFPGPSGGESLLILSRSPSRNLNDTISRFCRFLVGGPFGLMTRVRKKSKFKCRWILDHADVKDGVCLDSLLGDMEKQFRFDHLRTKMAKVEDAASSPTATVAPGPSTGATKSKKKPLATSTDKSISLEGEEGVKEDPSADLRQKRRKRKVQESFPEDAALGVDSAWEHEGFIREALGPWFPSSFLGPLNIRPASSLLAFRDTFFVGIKNAFSAKLKMEKELAAAKDQVAILTAERDSVLTSPPLKPEVDSLTE